jgi:hypothetical protein
VIGLVITLLDVNVNPFEHMVNRGTIIIYSGGSCKQKHPVLSRLSAIENPYEVAKKLNKVMVDVKADLNCPNAFRLEENPSYRTAYAGAKNIR